MMSIKAFTLVTAVERELLTGDKEHISIECVECCGRNLYVGTNDCFIYHFLLEEKAMPTGTASFIATKQLHRHLGFKKPVNELCAASALNRLLVLCDNSITLVNMLNLEPVPSGARIKGATTFAVNENPVNGDPFCVEVCIISVKRRTVQMFLVYEDRVQIVKEVSTPEQPLAVAVDGYFLCLALTTQYIILNYSTGLSQDLFPYCSEEKPPIVKRIGRQEFLLAGPGGLGMFATVAGISQRAPVHWSENVIGAAVCFPYVIALDDEFITVHSMLDQQQKQTLPFKEGHILQDFEGRVIVATSKGVYILVPLPLEKQIQDLLASRRVEEALVLAKGARRNIPKEKFQVMYRRILQQAGFIQFAQLQFLEAKELFRSSQLDVRELISLYPFLLPTSSSFTRSHPPLHEYADLNHLTQGDQEKMAKCKRFLMSYLNEIRSTEVANGYKEDIDTALLKLYAEADHDSLLDLLVTENSCLLTDSAAWLEKHKKYFALGLLYHYNKQDASAVQLWVNIVNGDIQDSTRSDLYEYIVDFLTYCLDQELVWTHADWLLQKSEEIGVQVFTKRPLDEQQQTRFNPDDIISCLKKYPKALVKYLEHLVIDRRLQPLSNYVLPFPWEESGEKIQGAGLPMESAILHGKLGEHEALQILVHGDFSAAEDYCLWGSEGQDSLPSAPFHTLAMGYEDSIHARRTTQVALGLAKSENLIYMYDKMKGSAIRLSEKALPALPEPLWYVYTPHVCGTQEVQNRMPNLFGTRDTHSCELLDPGPLEEQWAHVLGNLFGIDQSKGYLIIEAWHAEYESVLGPMEAQERLELELRTPASHHVDAGNQSWVPCKSKSSMDLLLCPEHLELTFLYQKLLVNVGGHEHNGQA
ncbi:hypothetical protein STEG23_035869 [Scotinomys teguina]